METKCKNKGEKGGKELLGDRETKIANVSVLSGELWLGDVAKHGCRKNVKENCHSIVTAMWMTGTKSFIIHDRGETKRIFARFLNEASESTATMVSLFESRMRWQRIICNSMGNLWAMAKKRMEVV